MRTLPPDGFDLARFYEGIYLFQSWEFFPGHRTSGPKDVAAKLATMNFPDDLTGTRVLDIAPWNGFFSFECVRRGAAEVVSLGPEDPLDTGYEQARALLGIDNVRYARGSVYDLSIADHGRFDIVLFLGLIYHLRHPLLALDRIYDVCDGQLFIDTPYIDNVVFDLTISEDQKAAILSQGRVVNELPMLYYTGGIETGDAYNWFMPNLRAFHSLVASSGFDVTDEGNDGSHWCWSLATKGTRRFEIGLEGYNPNAARA